MSFHQWLRQFRGDESAIGDLARDALADAGWPRGPGSLRRHEDHLQEVGASEPALETLRTAWSRYEHGGGTA